MMDEDNMDSDAEDLGLLRERALLRPGIVKLVLRGVSWFVPLE